MNMKRKLTMDDIELKTEMESAKVEVLLDLNILAMCLGKRSVKYSDFRMELEGDLLRLFSTPDTPDWLKRVLEDFDVYNLAEDKKEKNNE